ncbi:hypothetical protein HYV50_03100 [Candidatus Pacearchaeota archaeon]|nr:hypothetical protein [Candidatus Pacearchaeota archaeon]
MTFYILKYDDGKKKIPCVKCEYLPGQFSDEILARMKTSGADIGFFIDEKEFIKLDETKGLIKLRKWPEKTPVRGYVTITIMDRDVGLRQFCVPKKKIDYKNQSKISEL